LLEKPSITTSEKSLTSVRARYRDNQIIERLEEAAG